LNKTIIYYSSNVEDPEMEKKITDGIKESAGDIPIISVSQKPMNFGKNICVGLRGNTYLNAFRQLLIGCKKATTDFVIMAEADFLYHPDYFNFEPTDQNVVYTYDNVWVLWMYNGPFRHKEQTHGSVIYGREFLINLLEKSLKGLPEWSETKVPFPFYTDEKMVSFTGTPIISLKTGAGVQKSTKTNGYEWELPYWGTNKEVRKRIWTH
jgi:hypothetical protein